MRIKKIEYADEAESNKEENLEEDGRPQIYMKKVTLSGISFWHDNKKINPPKRPTTPQASSFDSPPSSPGSFQSFASESDERRKRLKFLNHKYKFFFKI